MAWKADLGDSENFGQIVMPEKASVAQVILGVSCFVQMVPVVLAEVTEQLIY